jgi:hypothetical protein
MIRNGDQYSLHTVTDATRLDDDLVPTFVSLMPRRLWRNTARPTIQIAIPYVFVCDEECYLSQLPPYLEPEFLGYPGLLISGRFPTHVWPRVLNLALEWCDLDRDLILKRGKAMCYVHFETSRPSASIVLRRARHTAALRDYRQNIEDVAKFAGGTFSLIREAERRRPAMLLELEEPDANDQ